MSAMVDERGNRYGSLVVIGRALAPPGASNPTVAWWAVRCDCGDVRAVAGQALRQRALLHTDVGCDRCVRRRVGERLAGPAAKVAGARRGWCSWCPPGKKARGVNNPHECSACERAAVRNGRDESGRPIRIGRVEGGRRGAVAALRARARREAARRCENAVSA